MSTREQNERKYVQWDDLPGGFGETALPRH